MHDSWKYFKVVSVFTPAEMETLKLMAHGLTNEEIARSRAVSLTTVKSQVRSIMNRMGFDTRVECVACAIREGLIE